MGLLCFIVAVTFWPGMAGAADASRWASLCVLVPIGLFFVVIRPTVIHVIGALLIGYMALSMLWTPVGFDGVAELMQVAVIAGMFLIGHETDDLTPLYRGLGLGLWVSSGIAIAQWLGYEPVVIVAPDNTPGLFINPNTMGEIAAVVILGLVVRTYGRKTDNVETIGIYKGPRRSGSFN